MMKAIAETYEDEEIKKLPEAHKKELDERLDRYSQGKTENPILYISVYTNIELPHIPIRKYTSH